MIVDGMESFEKTFSPFKDYFVIIGGAACRATLSEGRIIPRKTKDIDMVLVLERLDADFVKTFWNFMKDGRYKCGVRKDVDGNLKYVLYSFYGGRDGFPPQIELLSRPTEHLGTPDDHHIEVIKVDDDSSYLSAIILEQDYYNYLVKHTEYRGGLNFASVDSLICLKVLAYLNLREDKIRGMHVNDDDYKKHRRDVIMAVASLKISEEFVVPARLKSSILKFVEIIREEEAARKSLIASLKLESPDMLEGYLSILESNFTEE